MRSRFRPMRGADLANESGVTENAVPQNEGGLIGPDSALEELGLSMRTRNALRGIGCDTVEDVLELDLRTSVRGLGRKTKEELLVALERAGFQHPTLEDQPTSEIRVLERSLERMQGRLEGAVKEIRLLKQRLRRVVPRRGE